MPYAELPEAHLQELSVERYLIAFINHVRREYKDWSRDFGLFELREVAELLGD